VSYANQGFKCQKGPADRKIGRKSRAFSFKGP